MRRFWLGSALPVAAIAAVTVAAAVSAAPALATITPALTLDQSAGTTAGSMANLGMDLKFAPSSGDSPMNLTLTLPPGLLANASIDGGRCLTTTTPTSACEVGSGTVTADGLGVVPVTGDVAFDLVAPPAKGDLAGLALMFTLFGSTSQLGSPGAITVRPTGDPAGVGLDIAFTGIPDSYAGLPISVTELDTTFDALRLPASCPSPAANVTVSANSYSSSTARTASAPLQVSDCSALPYQPAFRVTATKDDGDPRVKLVTDITQTAGQATSRSVTLAFPPSLLEPNTAAVVGGDLFCTSPGSATCKTIGTASASSPLYPTPLEGNAYLTGTLLAPAIAVAFPSPFSLTLDGSVSLGDNSTSFTGVPDIPLTDLQVTLAGGTWAVFESPCSPGPGTATATLTDANGDRTVRVSAPVSVTGCASSTEFGAGGSGSLPAVPRAQRPRLSGVSFSGLIRGRPTLRFRLTTPAHAPKLSALTVTLPPGLSFLGRRAGRRLTVRGLSLAGTRARSAALARGRLTVALRTPARSVRVRLGPRALYESLGLEKRARAHRVKRLKLTVVVITAAHRRATLTSETSALGL